MPPPAGIGLVSRRCPWCQKTFRKRAHLARHVTSHTREKPFTCETCQKSFSRHDSLLRHTRLHLTTGNVVATAPSGSNAVLGSQLVPMSASPPDGNPNEHEQHCIEPSLDLGHSSGSNLTSVEYASSYSNSLAPEHRRLSTGAWVELAHPPPASPNSSAIPASDALNLNALLIRQITDATNGMGVPPLFLPPTGGQVPDKLNTPSASLPRLAHQCWFTSQRPSRTERQDAVEDAEMITSCTHLNDTHRIVLHETLYQCPPELALPSTEFLNICISRYFSQFHPVFPLLHLPTFRPSTENTLVLLAICCIGSLFQGHRQAVRQGQLISEQLNKAVLNSWISSGRQTEYQALYITQAAVLGQTYALLSGRPKDLAVLSSFHGTVLAWSRQEKYMEGEVSIPEPNPQDLEKSWATWVRREQEQRIAATLHIHDFEMARLFVSEPTLHQHPFSLPWLAPADVWDAPSAGDWSQLVNRHLELSMGLQECGGGGSTGEPRLAWEQLARRDHFNVGIKLMQIAAVVIEDNRLGSSPQTAGFLEESLLSMCRERLAFRGPDHFRLRPLWHSVFIVLAADICKLERAAGKDGDRGPSLEKNLEYASRWAASRDAHRAILHGLVLFRELESITIRAVTPVHVSSSLYHAAMAWYCYLRFSPPDRAYTQLRADEFPEFGLLGIDTGSLMLEAHDFQPFRPSVQDSLILSGLIDMLNRIGYWGLTRSIASLFRSLAADSTENTGQL
ncbi:hypothetical protein BJX99DRAFT_134280 [Aspergillus californicus]